MEIQWGSQWDWKLGLQLDLLLEKQLVSLWGLLWELPLVTL